MARNPDPGRVEEAGDVVFASTDNGDSRTVATPAWHQSGIAVNDIDYLDTSAGTTPHLSCPAIVSLQALLTLFITFNNTE